MATIPNHIDVVKAARARYAALAGPERAHRIVNAVAWELREEGAGLFLKTGGTRFADRSIDVIIFKSGETFDVLKDAEGKAEPAWSRTRPTGMGDPGKWRAAVDPGPVSDGASAPLEPSNPALDVTAEIKAIRGALDALIARLEP
jgi:hypothetical protein